MSQTPTKHRVWAVAFALTACALLAGPMAAQPPTGAVERLSGDIQGLRREVRRQRGEVRAVRREIAITRVRMSVLVTDRDRLRAEVRRHAEASSRAGAIAASAAVMSLCVLGVLFLSLWMGRMSRSFSANGPAAKVAGDLTGRIRALDGRLRELEEVPGPKSGGSPA